MVYLKGLYLALELYLFMIYYLHPGYFHEGFEAAWLFTPALSSSAHSSLILPCLTSTEWLPQCHQLTETPVVWALN